MRRIAISAIRTENLRALKRYERLGKRIFLKALREQANSYDPAIMVNAYVEFYENAFIDSAKREFNRIRVMNRKDFIPDGFFLATWRAWIGPYVKDKLGTMIANVNDNTLAKIQEALAESVELGLNPFETAKFIDGIIGNPARSLGIARTESTRANSWGKERSATDWANETGTELWKLWVHGGSREPREDHVLMGRENPIRKDQKFSLGGGMDFPGDPSGGAGQTVNCSCTTVYMSEDYVRRYYPNSFDSPDPTVTGGSVIPSIDQAYRPATNLDEAIQVSENIINNNTVLRVKKTTISKEITLDQLNNLNEQLDKLTKEYNLSSYLAGEDPIDLSFESTSRSYGFVESNAFRIFKVNFGHKFAPTARTSERVGRYSNGMVKFAQKSKVNAANAPISTLTHEFAHVIAVEKKLQNARNPELQSFWKEITKAKTQYKKEIGNLSRSGDYKSLEDIYLGDYAMTNKNEFMAEAFTEYKLSSNPGKYALIVGRLIDKYFKKN